MASLTRWSLTSQSQPSSRSQFPILQPSRRLSRRAHLRSTCSGRGRTAMVAARSKATRLSIAKTQPESTSAVNVQWERPYSDGGSKIQGYKVEYSEDSAGEHICGQRAVGEAVQRWWQQDP